MRTGTTGGVLPRRLVAGPEKLDRGVSQRHGAGIALLGQGGATTTWTLRLRRLGAASGAGPLPAQRRRASFLKPHRLWRPDVPANASSDTTRLRVHEHVVADDLRHQRFNTAWSLRRPPEQACTPSPSGVSGGWTTHLGSTHGRVRAHPPVRVASAYYSGRPGSPWVLASKPRAARYRQLSCPSADPLADGEAGRTSWEWRPASRARQRLECIAGTSLQQRAYDSFVTIRSQFTGR